MGIHAAPPFDDNKKEKDGTGMNKMQEQFYSSSSQNMTTIPTQSNNHSSMIASSQSSTNRQELLQAGRNLFEKFKQSKNTRHFLTSTVPPPDSSEISTMEGKATTASPQNLNYFDNDPYSSFHFSKELDDKRMSNEEHNDLTIHDPNVTDSYSSAVHVPGIYITASTPVPTAVPIATEPEQFKLDSSGSGIPIHESIDVSAAMEEINLIPSPDSTNAEVIPHYQPVGLIPKIANFFSSGSKNSIPVQRVESKVSPEAEIVLAQHHDSLVPAMVVSGLIPQIGDSNKSPTESESPVEEDQASIFSSATSHADQFSSTSPGTEEQYHNADNEQEIAALKATLELLEAQLMASETEKYKFLEEWKSSEQALLVQEHQNQMAFEREQLISELEATRQNLLNGFESLRAEKSAFFSMQADFEAEKKQAFLKIENSQAEWTNLFQDQVTSLEVREASLASRELVLTQETAVLEDNLKQLAEQSEQLNLTRQQTESRYLDDLALDGSSQNQNELFELKATLLELESSCIAKSDELVQFSHRLDTREAALIDMQNDLFDKQAALLQSESDFEKRLQQLNDQEIVMQARALDLSTQATAITRDAAENDQKSINLDARFLDLQDNLSELEEKLIFLNEKEQSLISRDEELSKAEKLLKSEEQDFLSQKESFAASLHQVTADQVSLLDEKSILKNSLERLELEKIEFASQQNLLKDQQEDVRANFSAIEAERESLLEQRLSFDEEISWQREQLDIQSRNTEEQLKQLEAEKNILEDQVKLLEVEKNNINLNIQQRESELLEKLTLEREQLASDRAHFLSEQELILSTEGSKLKMEWDSFDATKKEFFELQKFKEEEIDAENIRLQEQAAKLVYLEAEENEKWKMLQSKFAKEKENFLSEKAALQSSQVDLQRAQEDLQLQLQNLAESKNVLEQERIALNSLAKASSLSKDNDTLEAVHNRNLSFEVQLLDKERTLLEQEDALSQMETLLLSQESSLQERESQLSDIILSMQQQSVALQNMEISIQQDREALNESKSKLQSIEDSLLSKEKELQIKDTNLLSKENSVANLETAVQEKEKELLNRENDISYSLSILEEKNKELMSLESKQATLEKEKASFQSEKLHYEVALSEHYEKVYQERMLNLQELERQLAAKENDIEQELALLREEHHRQTQERSSSEVSGIIVGEKVSKPPNYSPTLESARRQKAGAPDLLDESLIIEALRSTENRLLAEAESLQAAYSALYHEHGHYVAECSTLRDEIAVLEAERGVLQRKLSVLEQQSDMEKMIDQKLLQSNLHPRSTVELIRSSEINESDASHSDKDKVQVDKVGSSNDLVSLINSFMQSIEKEKMDDVLEKIKQLNFDKENILKKVWESFCQDVVTSCSALKDTDTGANLGKPNHSESTLAILPNISTPPKSILKKSKSEDRLSTPGKLRFADDQGKDINQLESNMPDIEEFQSYFLGEDISTLGDITNGKASPNDYDNEIFQTPLYPKKPQRMDLHSTEKWLSNVYDRHSNQKNYPSQDVSLYYDAAGSVPIDELPIPPSEIIPKKVAPKLEESLIPPTSAIYGEENSIIPSGFSFGDDFTLGADISLDAGSYLSLKSPIHSKSSNPCTNCLTLKQNLESLASDVAEREKLFKEEKRQQENVIAEQQAIIADNALLQADLEENIALQQKRIQDQHQECREHLSRQEQQKISIDKYKQEAANLETQCTEAQLHLLDSREGLARSLEENKSLSETLDDLREKYSSLELSLKTKQESLTEALRLQETRLDLQKQISQLSSDKIALERILLSVRKELQGFYEDQSINRTSSGIFASFTDRSEDNMSVDDRENLSLAGQLDKLLREEDTETFLLRREKPSSQALKSGLDLSSVHSTSAPIVRLEYILNMLNDATLILDEGYLHDDHINHENLSMLADRLDAFSLMQSDRGSFIEEHVGDESSLNHISRKPLLFSSRSSKGIEDTFPSHAVNNNPVKTLPTDSEQPSILEKENSSLSAVNTASVALIPSLQTQLISIQTQLHKATLKSRYWKVRCRKELGFRSDLIYQKKYFLLTLQSLAWDEFSILHSRPTFSIKRKPSVLWKKAKTLIFSLVRMKLLAKKSKALMDLALHRPFRVSDRLQITEIPA